MSPWTEVTGWITVSGVDVYVCQGLEPGPKVVVTAGIHGDEYEGVGAALELVSTLHAGAVSGTVAIVPAANAGALHAGTRTSPADGLNLARTFPGNAAGSETEQLAAGLFEWIRQANFAIDLHSGGVEYDFLPLAGFYGKAEPGNPSFEAARRFGLPHLWSLPPTGGVLSNELWQRGIPCIGCEYRGAGQLAPDGVHAYAEGVRSCLRYWGVLPDEPAAPSGTVVSGDWLLTSATGLFVAGKRLGDSISAGERIAHIIDQRGQRLQEFYAPYDGTVLAIRAKAFVKAGSWGVLSVQHS